MNIKVYIFSLNYNIDEIDVKIFVIDYCLKVYL